MAFGGNCGVVLLFVLTLAALAFSQRTDRWWKTRIPGYIRPVNEKSRNYTKHATIKVYSKEHPTGSGYQNATSMKFGDTWAIKVFKIPNAGNAKRRACFITRDLTIVPNAVILDQLIKRNVSMIIDKTNPFDLYVNSKLTLAQLEQGYMNHGRFLYHCKNAVDQAGVYTLSKHKNILPGFYKAEPLNVLGPIPVDPKDYPKSQHVRIHLLSNMDLTEGFDKTWPRQPRI